MITITAGTRTGDVTPPASKSMAHRLLILAALQRKPLLLEIEGLSEDIEATAACLQALGAGIRKEKTGLYVTPIGIPDSRPLPGGNDPRMGGNDLLPGAKNLPCKESGSTLRFLLPLAAVLGVPAVFQMEGRLSRRPVLPLVEALKKNGAMIENAGERLILRGKLRPGTFDLPGDVSSQFVTGLLLSLPLLPGESRIVVHGKLESEDYLRMTEKAMKLAGLRFEIRREDTAGEDSTALIYRIQGFQKPSLPSLLFVERDWSAAANFLVMGAFSQSGIRIHGLDPDSTQGDRRILEILKKFGADVRIENENDAKKPVITVRKGTLLGQEIDASMIPDIVPVLSVLGALSEGETRILGAARLRLKESDRLKTTAAFLKSLGAIVTELPDGLLISGKSLLQGGEVPECRDHRIAMAAAAAASGCTAPVTIPESDCVAKSYPAFFTDLLQLEKEQLL